MEREIHFISYTSPHQLGDMSTPWGVLYQGGLGESSIFPFKARGRVSMKSRVYTRCGMLLCQKGDWNSVKTEITDTWRETTSGRGLLMKRARQSRWDERSAGWGGITDESR